MIFYFVSDFESTTDIFESFFGSGAEDSKQLTPATVDDFSEELVQSISPPLTELTSTTEEYSLFYNNNSDSKPTYQFAFQPLESPGNCIII